MTAEIEYSAVHPGEILLEEFLRPLGISQRRLAREIGVSVKRVNDIVNGKTGIHADMALRLGRYFSVSPQFWMNLQARYDLQVMSARMGKKLENEVRVFED